MKNTGINLHDLGSGNKLLDRTPEMQSTEDKIGTSLMVQWLRICQSREVSVIPDWRTKILHAAGQLSLHTPTRETTCSGALVPHLLSLGFPEPTRHSWRSPLAITETQCSPQIKKTKLINQALSKLKLLYTKGQYQRCI